MLHRTVRISSSAVVGLGGAVVIYENVTSKIFVCQEPCVETGLSDASAATLRHLRADCSAIFR